MRKEEEYEIFPHKLLEDLKYDVEALKKKLSEPETTSQELIVEMEELKGTLKELGKVFKEALQEIKGDDSVKLLMSLQHKVETITTQNETIARGMVAISDKLEDFMKAKIPPASPPKIAPKMVAPKMPVFPGEPSRVAPYSSGAIPAPPSELASSLMPPPPPLANRSKRTGLFK